MSASTIQEQAAAIRTSAEALVSSGEAGTVSDETIQALMAAAVRLYAAKVEANGGFPVVPQGTLTATDAMVAASGLLRAVNVQVFELGLWQAWSH